MFLEITNFECLSGLTKSYEHDNKNQKSSGGGENNFISPLENSEGGACAQKKRKDVSIKIIIRSVKRYYAQISKLENNRKLKVSKEEEVEFFNDVSLAYYLKV